MLSRIRTVGSAVERFVDIEEVTGSIPVRSTTRCEPMNKCPNDIGTHLISFL
jgi:hypothetical protein